MEVLRIENLTKNFGGLTCLDEVSFSVDMGEKIALIGPNGAGKTTLFNIINGQLPPTKGRVFFFGKEITTMATFRRAHGGQSRSFQITSLFFPLTVLENCMIALHGKRPSRFNLFRTLDSYGHLLDRVRELLESAALWDQRDEPVENLSYGDQRRLDMIVSLASNPSLLLLDEPSAGLTAEESTAIMHQIKSLGKDVTTIMVAHDMDLVFGLADRIIVLHYGQIIAEGTPAEIKVEPRVREIYMGAKREIENA